MKIFYIGKQKYTFSCYQIDAVPAKTIAEASVPLQFALAKTICEDACYLSSDGGNQIALELRRIAKNSSGDEIGHYISIRCRDESEKGATMRHEACAYGMLTAMTQSGYVVHEISFEEYAHIEKSCNTDTIWGIKKATVQECGIHETYVSTPIVESVDWDAIYSALDGSGCDLRIQIIPSLATASEQKVIIQNHMKCCQASTGAISNIRDPMAESSNKRWQHYAEQLHNPMASVNITVSGSASKVAIVTARIRQSICNGPYLMVPIDSALYNRFALYDQPWQICKFITHSMPNIMEKWSTEEIAQIFSYPIYGEAFTGLRLNPFSFVPEIDLIPKELKDPGQEGILIGCTAQSNQAVSLPTNDLLLHTAVFGKSGVGKTTLMKQMISDFHKRGIPVLILEPVKREYRSIYAQKHGTRIFTVESPAVPLLINPFHVPVGVSLGDYRSSLLSAFKAAFSMPDPLPSLFERAISDAYSIYGWTDQSKSDDPDVCIFDMAEFIKVFRRVILTSSYSNEVKGNLMAGGAFRLQSLIERCPRTFDNCFSTDVTDLLTGQVVLEMGKLEPEQRSLVAALVLFSVLAYLKTTRDREEGLKNIILIDEAHAFLDQGDGATTEEKTLNSTMNQLLINLIAEIRAYGVGIVFSDQSPSRIGSKLMDNVNNIIAFRLSGDEASMLQKCIGADQSVTHCLPLLKTGEMLVSNHRLRRPLAVQMLHNIKDDKNITISDSLLAKYQRDYLTKNSSKYCPYKECKTVGCVRCSAGVRETARKVSTQIFATRGERLTKPEDLAGHVIGIPTVMASNGYASHADFEKLCCCTAVHLLRKCSSELCLSFASNTLPMLISEMKRKDGESI